MLKEREFRTEATERPVDNRFGADFAQRRGSYDYYTEEQAQPRYDAYERSYEERTYDDARYYEDAYYGAEQREYPREDYARQDAFPRYETYEVPQQNAYDNYRGQQSFEDYGRKDTYGFNAGYSAPQASAFEHVEYQTKKTTKRTLNAKSKMLIAVYFVLVAVIASLIIANVVAFGGASVEAQAPAEAAYNEEALNMAVTADGSVVEMKEVRYLENYGYEKNTNWFDSFCDWVAGISK